MTPAIALLGDVMLGRAVAERTAGGEPEKVWSDEVREICRSCDLVIANLECCISERGEPTERIPGKPFFFRSPPAGIRSLEAIGMRAVGLANNHALDYEAPALLDTLDLLDDAGIAPAGAGRTPAEARRGAVVEAAGARIGMFAVSDHPEEFAAGPGATGIAYADLWRGIPDWAAEELGRLRAECDLVVAFPHWGPNMTAEPAPWQRHVAGELVAAGADLVAGHSAHVFHGVGWSDRGPLLFDLGDALDDYAVDEGLRNDLGVLAIWRPCDPGSELELVGLALDYCHTRLATGEDTDWIAARLDRACQPLGTRAERLEEQRFRLSPS